MALGVRQSHAAFSRMIARLVDANYIDPQPAVRSDRGQTVHCRCYEITDQGIHDWMAARKFYLNLAPPSPDLMPVPTRTGQLAPYESQDSPVNDHVRRSRRPRAALCLHHARHRRQTVPQEKKAPPTLIAAESDSEKVSDSQNCFPRWGGNRADMAPPSHLFTQRRYVGAVRPLAASPDCRHPQTLAEPVAL